MAGTLIPIVQKKRYDFSFVISGSKSIDLAKAINVVPFTRATLLVQLHGEQIDASGASFDIEAFKTYPSPVDPAEFTQATAVLTVSRAQGASPGAPVLLSDSTTSDVGPYLKIQLTANQGSSQAALWIEVSVSLLVHED